MFCIELWELKYFWENSGFVYRNERWWHTNVGFQRRTMRNQKSTWNTNRFSLNNFPTAILSDIDQWPRWVRKVWAKQTVYLPSLRICERKNNPIDTIEWFQCALNKIYHIVINRLDTLDINLIMSPNHSQFDLFLFRWNWDYQVNCNCWICG